MTSAKLLRLQRASALVFAAFLAVHLAAVAASLFGAGALDEALALSRRLYRWLPVELALAAAVLVHAGASLLLWRRRPDGLARPLGAQLQTWAGFGLLALIAGHVAFMRVAPAVVGFDADHLYLWTALEVWPTLFAPYYVVLAAAGAYHLVFGLRRYMGRGPERGLDQIVFAAVTAFFIAVAVHLPGVAPRRDLDDARLRAYLAPFAAMTPWLIDMGEEHPLIRRYQGKPPLAEPAP